MGLQAAGVHLPIHRIDGKRAREAGLARGFEALRVPAWDEDPLTMAIEAGLRLPDEALRGVERVRLFTDEPHEQTGLVSRALELEAPITQSTGPGALVAEATGGFEREELWLAAGRDVGGAGLALRLTEGEGPRVQASASRGDAGLDPDARSALNAAFEAIEAGEAVPRLLAPRWAADLEETEARRVGNVGAAGAGLELAGHLARAEEPRLVGDWSEGQAHAILVAEGSVPVEGLEEASVDMEPEAYRRREQARPEPWSEASQGAYVSREVYDHDPERRYGARAVGEGRIAATTTIEAGPPAEFARQHEAEGPYDVVIVELDRGGREIGQAAVPPGTLSIGDRVRPVLRRVFSMEDQTRYGLKWRPAEG